VYPALLSQWLTSAAAWRCSSAFPQATTSPLETAVINNTTDLGGLGPDNAYGNGMLGVQAAYNRLTAGIHAPASARCQ
jgi:hypothetical protein